MSNENCQSCIRAGRVKEYEQLLTEAMLGAKEMQDFLWDKQNYIHKPFDPEAWIPLFQKRVDKLSEVSVSHSNYKVEMRKRLLQQAALSLQAILCLHEMETVYTHFNTPLGFLDCTREWPHEGPCALDVV